MADNKKNESTKENEKKGSGSSRQGGTSKETDRHSDNRSTNR